ncbi:LLM class oxidoreductase [Pacificoceanicola onchidii]|uniref:LLM class oxidoreductase n=1 Tax=Pacificoceanicola onchidii TaxID=2562685 RepID=UPI00198121E7|nr:LLM class oxidoreductase [Pacificoceanicola onchidii]
MIQTGPIEAFQRINRGYNSIFRAGRLSIGLVVPLETYATGPVPMMQDQLKRIRLAEALGFSAVWLRDVPFNVPSFGDAGQIYDPFVYLGLLAGQTSRIALGVGSIVLPLRHPAHVAKSAASVDDLSDGRLILGVASGDRPEEYPAMDLPYQERGEKFRESYAYIRRMGEQRPAFEGLYDSLNGLDMLPKPVGGKLPLLITGACQQSPDWLARHGDGWMVYPRPVEEQQIAIAEMRGAATRAGQPPKPVLQPLYIDLLPDDASPPRPIHLGYRLGVQALRTHLKSMEEAGINHVALNLRFNQLDLEQTLRVIADQILPHFAD